MTRFTYEGQPADDPAAFTEEAELIAYQLEEELPAFADDDEREAWLDDRRHQIGPYRYEGGLWFCEPEDVWND